jgi:small-conductance mechanosensitive channel
VIILLRGRYRRILKQIEERYEGSQRYYRWLCLFLLRRSLPYLGVTLVLGLYSSVQFSLFDIELGRLFFYIFLVLLITRRGLDYLKHGFRGPPTALRSFVSLHLKRFFRIYRIAIIVFLMLLWIAGRDSLLAWMARTAVSAGFLAWAIVFWRQMKPVVAEGVRLGQSAPNPKRIALVRGLTYLVFGGNLMLNLSGYGILSGLWFRACSEMVALLFWAWISLNAVREWHRELRDAMAATDEDNPLTVAHHWRWSLIQLARAVWLVGLTAGIVWIGDPSGYIWPQIGHFFKFTVTLGTLNLSIKGIVLAIVIIFLTLLASRVGRALSKEKILDKRSLERGLKDSVLTITSYLGWGLGLLLALGSLGVNATSLAVIFGAISIGIGFGLPNIFNNFISGLILLFERPIQVGDYVEVGGLWAEIKKINVRATVVQTFDNASLIIPNSEFISQQVTNWSFKDKRMRRNLDIGGAYGSDIDLVQQTLLNIARETRGVLKYPQPDVLFIDHADSALIFRLRIWVNIDDSLKVASQVRCEIDRRFRELAIEIAFPQRDLHIRTIPREIAPIVSPGDSDGAPSNFQKDS